MSDEMSNAPIGDQEVKPPRKTRGKASAPGAPEGAVKEKKERAPRVKKEKKEGAWAETTPHDIPSTMLGKSIRVISTTHTLRGKRGGFTDIVLKSATVDEAMNTPWTTPEGVQVYMDPGYVQKAVKRGLIEIVGYTPRVVGAKKEPTVATEVQTAEQPA
jgi:hypothetical protein